MLCGWGSQCMQVSGQKACLGQSTRLTVLILSNSALTDISKQTLALREGCQYVSLQRTAAKQYVLRMILS